jgi:dihydrofolate reductase
MNHVSLDGVMQGPGRRDEDTRGGFDRGGWATPESDPAMAKAMGAVMGGGFSWLFGRRSYEDMLGHWNREGGPFKEGLNGTTKYVASSNPELALPWPNSTLLSGDVPGAIAELRARPGGSLVIMGSGQLIRSLLPHGLIDELLLMIHPIVLGVGQRLFPDAGAVQPLELRDSAATRSGIVLATYAWSHPGTDDATPQ